MKLFSLFILSIMLAGPLTGQEKKEHLITKTYYDKWSVTYFSEELFEYQRGSDDSDSKVKGLTILYFPMTMIDDGIYGSLGLVLTKEKKPEYILELSFPVGIGNKSYEDPANNDMDVRFLLLARKDTVLKTVSYESLEDQVTVGGSEFKGRLYRFAIDRSDFSKLKELVPDKMLLYFKGKNNKSKPKSRPAGSSITSENSMINKFSSFANSMSKVKILEIH
ncbi:MAG TPA: hypothetical protein VGI38_08975 [Puia sp.]|jgi:hypothetical protein